VSEKDFRLELARAREFHARLGESCGDLQATPSGHIAFSRSNLADPLAPIFGSALALASKLPPKGVALLLGLTSGFFLFTATGHLLPQANRRSVSFNVPIATIVGVLFIALAVRLVLAI
jgi:hypothetical protein